MSADATVQRIDCIICGKGRFDTASDVARVPSNVRRWRQHENTAWRCPSCGCIHCLEREDLTLFYQDYPYGRRTLDNFTRRVFGYYMHRLQGHGLSRNDAILDYGCSTGLLLQHLRESGYTNCTGYDPYSLDYNDPSVLDRSFDLIVCQDVIEHVEDPRELMATLARVARPGGLVCIGTPRADDIDLQHPEQAIHSLHMPFHLHILSEGALTHLAEESGLVLERLYLRHSCDTPTPFVNWPFLRAYLKTGDDTLDAGFDPPRIAAVATSPRLWLLGLVGYWFPERGDMIAVFRKPQD